MRALAARSNRDGSSSIEDGERSMATKLLWLELAITVFLDTANELLGFFGFPLVLGQLTRFCFLAINVIVIFEFGKRKETQAVVLIFTFFALMILREVSLGMSAMSYAAVYWAKFLLYVSTFFAIKCAGSAGGITVDSIERFFKWSIMFIAPAFLVLAILGVLDQRSFDLGYEGSILSKNSMSVTLLLLFVVSLFLVFRKRLSFLWSIVVAVSLFLLGSKATIAFALVIALACFFHELRRLSSRGLLTVGVMLAGICLALWLFWDSVSAVVGSQLQRYRYVLTQQDGSIADYLLTGRGDLLEAGLTSFLDDLSLPFLIVGSGISTLSSGVASFVDAAVAYRGIEMDIFEIALASGIVGICVMLAPFVMSLGALREYRTTDSFYLALGLLITFGFMTLGGHVVTEGMPAAYFGTYLAYICMLPGSENSHCSNSATTGTFQRNGGFEMDRIEG